MPQNFKPLTIELHSKAQAWAAIKEAVFPFLANHMRDGVRLVLTITSSKRTPAQNRRYWGGGVLAQVSQQAVVNGRLFSAETWHEQFKRQFIGVIEMPDGTVRAESSKDLDKASFSEFCTKVEAYAASELGVTFYDLEGTK